ncbi:oligosaccharide flippase family protein [Arthrobacter sp. S39]|uniref:lipopolysaccharide biosynthesis protein n=1 Tax=Arthrobacter sp. S39 TaxID=2509720 RepID=UPI00325C0390
MTGPRAALLYLLGSLVQGVGLLLIQPFAIRVLDAEQWGLVSTSVVTIQVLVVLISAGLPLAITRVWFDAHNGRSRAHGMHSFLAMAALLLGLIFAGGVVAGSQVSGVQVPWPTLLAMLSIGLLGAILGAQAVLRAENRPLAFVVLSLISSVGANLAGLAAILFATPSATAYLTAYSCVVGAGAAVALVLVPPVIPWRVRGVMRESLSIALPLLPHTGALMLLTQGAVLLLAALSGAVPAGQFGAVLIFALGPLTLLNALNNAWSTRLMESAADKLPVVLRAVATEALLASAAIGILASSAASAGSIILTPLPDELAPVARILPLVSLGYGLFLIVTNVVYILDKTRSMAFITPLVLVAMASAAVPFAAAGDLLAVACIQGAGFFILGVAYWLVVRTTTHGSWPVGLFALLAAIHVVAVAVLSPLPVTLLAGSLQVASAGVLLLLVGLYLRSARRRSEHG